MRIDLHRLLLAGLIAVWPAGPALAQGIPPARDAAYLGAITLSVDATDLEHKTLQVRETLPVRAGHLTLLYPLWIPGNHGPVNEVKRLAGLRIDADGRPLPWRRDAEHLNAVHVEVPDGATRLTLVFRQLLPLEAEDSDSVLRKQLANIQWQGVVLYPAGYHASRIEVDAALRLPGGWQHGSALRVARQSGDELRFERVSLETLIDSPVFAGRHARRVPLDAQGKSQVFLDLFAEDPSALEFKEEAIEAHRELVRQADRLFGARHFAHYDVLLALGEDLPFGLEHHQSSENSAKPGYFKDWAKTVPARYLVPHEYVHSWNGKFRRPRSLWTADFNTPASNDLLWVYEGQTQYWGDLLSARSGMMGLEDVRTRLARWAAWLKASPGRGWRSLQDTTYDDITAGRKLPVDWATYQRFEDYYVEGELLWLDVDVRIRQMSGGARSLDDFARAFFGVEDGRVEPLLYDLADVIDALNRVQPFDWAGLLRERLDSTGSDAVFEGLERSGWRLAWSDKPTDYGTMADAYHGSADFTHSLGLTIGKEGAVSDVLWNGPAFRAGLRPGLTVLAVNMHAYDADRLRDAVTAAKGTEAPLELLLKDGADYRLARIDWRGGLRYPKLERIEGKPDLLTPILSPR